MHIRKDTIIKVGDHLQETNGTTWEVRTIEGLKFTISNITSKTQKVITKETMQLDPKWSLLIMDKRNYW